eukprot:1157129-Pelagomonas_calceolata.AAC.6
MLQRGAAKAGKESPSWQRTWGRRSVCAVHGAEQSNRITKIGKALGAVVVSALGMCSSVGSGGGKKRASCSGAQQQQEQEKEQEQDHDQERLRWACAALWAVAVGKRGQVAVGRSSSRSRKKSRSRTRRLESSAGGVSALDMCSSERQQLWVNGQCWRAGNAGILQRHLAQWAAAKAGWVQEVVEKYQNVEAGWVQEVVEKYQNGGVYGRIAESVLHKWAAVKAG